MNYIDSTLLPIIMELISREDNLCTTVEDLTKAVKDAVLAKHIHPFGSLDLAVRFALEVGNNMGILTMNDEVVPVPFNFQAKKPAPTTQYTTAQGRKAVKRELTKSRAKPKSKAKASAAKCRAKEFFSGKPAIYKRNTKGTEKIQKAKAKKRL